MTQTEGTVTVGHDVFLAHASADKPAARTFAEALREGGANVFLDEADVDPGDVWDRAIPDRHDASKVTVVLVSRHTLEAWYQRDEIAAAIERVRRGDRHRIVPVYLDHVERIPYGLRIVHGIWALDDAGRAEAVRRVLRLLPTLDDSPRVAVWSPHIPRENRFFAGREEVLARIAAGSSAGGAAVFAQTISGMGGVGKTTIAAQLCHEQRDVADVVWWVRAETESGLLDDLVALADEVGAGRAADGDRRATAMKVKTWFESTDREWLVVFDNVDDPNSIAPYLPDHGRGRVLVTTRRQGGFDLFGDTVPVDVFDEAAAVAFLGRRLSTAGSPEAVNTAGITQLARRLGGLPLALEHAAAYLAHSQANEIAPYLDLLDGAGDPFVEGRTINYEATATSTWRVSLDAATTRAPFAGALLAVLAQLAPQPFPRDALLAAAGGVLADALGGEVGCRAAVAELAAFSLLRFDTSATTVQIHRVVQDATRRTAPPGAPTVADAIALLRAVCPDDAYEPSTWERWRLLAPHAEIVADTPVDGANALALRWVLDGLATFRQHSGDLPVALPIFVRALRLAEATAGVDHPDTLTSRNNLASSYRSVGRYDTAIRLEERTFADRSRVLGVDHPDTLTSRNNLAGSYLAVGRRAEAISLFERNLTERERVLGVLHPDTLTSRGNLALSYWSVGRHDEAITLHEQNLADFERVLGVDHPDTLTSRNNLALSYRTAGRHDDAIILQERTLTDRERVLGADHPDTLTSRGNLASSYRSVGRYDDAITLLERTLTDRERVLGADHPDTLTSRGNLASSYWSVGRHDEAIPLLNQALTDSERVLGVDHPDTRVARATLAHWRQEAG